MKYFARSAERDYECTLDAQNGDVFVEVAGRRYRVDLQHIPGSAAYTLLVDGRSYEFSLHRSEEGVELSGAAGLFHIEVEDARTHAARAKTVTARGASGPHLIRSVMPGIVREVMIAVGEAVAKGQPLLILEAMKMQNEIRADRAGTVRNIRVSAEDTVDKGAPLVELA